MLRQLPAPDRPNATHQKTETDPFFSRVLKE
jgi:hypothetical protein